MAHLWGPIDTATVRRPASAPLRENSPRSGSENKSHTNLMAAASEVPPILVNWPSMRFFDGTRRGAFITHGMPLTGKDRKAAAARWVRSVVQRQFAEVTNPYKPGHYPIVAAPQRAPALQFEKLLTTPARSCAC